MIYQKNLSEPWFTLVSNGQKTIEGRLRDPQSIWPLLQIGDIIEFYNDQKGNRRTITVIIVGIKYFPTFEAMLKSEKLTNVLPTIRTYREGVAIYHQFYPIELEKKYGVIAFNMMRHI